MELAISHFSPLIQLLAGIYLVLCYDRVLKLNPFTKSLDEELPAMIRNIRMTYQSTDSLFPDDFQERIKKQWEVHSKSLTKIYILSFFYCVFLLVYSGFDLHGHQVVMGLPFLTLTVFFYIIAIVLWFNKKAFFKDSIWIVLILGGAIAGLHFCDPLNDKMINDWNWILIRYMPIWLVILSVITSGIGFLVFGIYCFSRFRKIRRTERAIRNATSFIRIVIKTTSTDESPLSALDGDALLQAISKLFFRRLLKSYKMSLDIEKLTEYIIQAQKDQTQLDQVVIYAVRMLIIPRVNQLAGIKE